MRIQTLQLGVLLSCALLPQASSAKSATGQPFVRAQQFLAKSGLEKQAAELNSSDIDAIDRALSKKGRKFSDGELATFLSNPVAWQGEQSRTLLSTILQALPKVAAVRGIDKALTLASNHNESNSAATASRSSAREHSTPTAIPNRASWPKSRGWAR